MIQSLIITIIIFFSFIIFSINSSTIISPIGGISNIETDNKIYKLSFIISCKSNGDSLSSDISSIVLFLSQPQKNEGGNGEANCILKKESLNLECEMNTTFYNSLNNSSDIIVNYINENSDNCYFENFYKVSSNYYLSVISKEINCLNYKLNLNFRINGNDIVYPTEITEFKMNYQIQNKKGIVNCIFPITGNEVYCVIDASNVTFSKGKAINFGEKINVNLTKNLNIFFTNMDSLVMEDTCGKDSYGDIININIINLIFFIIISLIN